MTTPHLLFSCCLLFLIPLLLLLSWTKSVLLCSASRSSEVLHYSTSLHLKSSCPVTYTWGDRSGMVGIQCSRCWMNCLFLQQHIDVYFFFFFPGYFGNDYFVYFLFVSLHICENSWEEKVSVEAAFTLHFSHLDCHIRFHHNTKGCNYLTHKYVIL